MTGTGMDAPFVIDMTRDAIVASLLVAGPVLAIGVIVGLLIGLLQALTQVQDQTVSFVPKLLAMIVGLTLCLPWIVEYMTDYSEKCFGQVPTQVHRQP